MLDIRAGGGLYCRAPKCALTLRDFRYINISSGSAVFSETASFSAHIITVGGSVFAQRVTVNAAALHLLQEGLMSTSNRQETSRIDMHVGPGAVPHANSLLPIGCSSVCLECTCLEVRRTLLKGSFMPP